MSSVVAVTISVLLQGLSAAIKAGVFGNSVEKVAPILDTVAALADLPDELSPQRAALLAQVQSWVTEGREPTDDELEAIAEQRESLYQQALAARQALG